MVTAFMPNFIHSLDASNVHLLLYNLSTRYKLPVYTVHDCFASTPNKMELLELKVKEAFIDIYFKDEGYLVKTHNSIIDQIKFAYETYIKDGKEYIDINIVSSPADSDIKVKDLELPVLPEAFKDRNLEPFVKGLLKSKYFID